MADPPWLRNGYTGVSGRTIGHHSGMACPRCTLADELERHARLIALGLEEAREAERLALTDEEREKVRRRRRGRQS